MKKIFLVYMLAMCFAAPSTALAQKNVRTFDQLAPAELDAVSKVTHSYYMCVAGKLETLRDVEVSAPEHIFEKYPPYIRIFRQQCRISLLGVEKELYMQSLNPEFILNYISTLRDDVEHFALQQALAALAQEKKGEERQAAEEKEKAARDLEEKNSFFNEKLPSGRGFPNTGR